MDELAQYKQSLLNQLTAEYNSALRLLGNQLKTNVNNINRQNILRTIKARQINNLIKIYNNNVRNLTTTFNQNKNKTFY